MTIRYRLHSIERDGTEWTSSESFIAETAQHVKQAVIAGYLLRTSRWATEEGTGRFIVGIDKLASPMFRSVLSESSNVLTYGLVVYPPAVRIYNPDPSLTLQACRGMSAIALAFAGDVCNADCVGWVEIGDIGDGKFINIADAIHSGAVQP